MAVAVASTSTKEVNDSATIVIDAPAGIAEGNLLLMVVTHANSTSVNALSTGFTQYAKATVDNGSGERGAVTILYKIAVSADESASTYTCTLSGGAKLGSATMLRVTDYAINTDGTPVFGYDTGTIRLTGSGGTEPTSQVVDIPRPMSQLHIIFASGFSDGPLGAPSSEINTQNYAIASADANPSWTEIAELDYSFQLGSGSAYGYLAVAYATSASTSSVTGYSLDYIKSSLNDPAQCLYGYLVLFTPFNDSGSNTLVTTTTTTFTATGVTNQSGSNTLATTTSEAFIQGGIGKQPTQWVAENRPSTSWVNEPL